MGTFRSQLRTWAERPCLLVVRLPAVASELQTVGILRAYHSVQSLRGWAIVPPVEHGGFAQLKPTELHLERAYHREVIMAEGHAELHFWQPHGDLRFTLTLARSALLRAPQRAVQTGRYLYVGGRRRTRIEDWMLDGAQTKAPDP